ncbi:MAG: carboxypeptidase-like regulatory domain-containing protein, partial [Sphingobacterium sp.]
MCSILIFPGIVVAQQKTVTGNVIDATTKSPLFGVTVKLSDAKNVTVSTDKRGGFVLDDVAIGQSITFSFVGYSSQTIKTDSRASYTIALVAVSNLMEETVVVGYGRQKKRNLTGSIVSVGASEIAKTTLQDPISILQGRAAGVQVSSNSGAPGGEMS